MSAPDGPGTVSLPTERGSKGATSYKHFAPLEQGRWAETIMAKPVIFVVDDKEDGRKVVALDLDSRYAQSYRAVCPR
jgi:hypothetical protein